MKTRITKEKVETSSGGKETFWVLWEISRPGINEPWVAIEESKKRTDLKRYQNSLDR